MNAYVAPLVRSTAVPAQSCIETFVKAQDFEHPTLVMDRSLVVAQFQALRQGLAGADIHYAVKANPAPEIIAALVAQGAHFDAASRGEIELCLAQGARPDQISFGNTIKRVRDIAFAHGRGVTLFAADASEEIEKIAQHAPGAEVYLRVLVGETGADWPLSRKFGADGAMIPALARQAAELGLRPVGLSFHVGSQTRDPKMWIETLDHMDRVWQQLRGLGFGVDLINIGGGFPAFHGEEILPAQIYAAQVMDMVKARFHGARRVIAEPGRGMVAHAGMISAEVVLVSRKSEDDPLRWVYLDIGKFSGLAETMDEAIRYQFVTEKDHQAHEPCVLAGPSCDSADVLYEKHPVPLPVGLCAGDRVLIRNCGAYTSSYASVGFNGFPPLDVIVL